MRGVGRASVIDEIGEGDALLLDEIEIRKIIVHAADSERIYGRQGFREDDDDIDALVHSSLLAEEFLIDIRDVLIGQSFEIILERGNVYGDDIVGKRSESARRIHPDAETRSCEEQEIYRKQEFLVLPESRALHDKERDNQ